MKLFAVLLIAGIFLSVCDAGSVSDRFKEFGRNFTQSANALKDKLKVVGGALKDVTIDHAKGFASQALQALAGALIESFKGFNIGDIFGKRGLEYDLQGFAASLVEEMERLLEIVFQKTFTRFAGVLQNLIDFNSVDELSSELTDITETHKMAVRGVIGDTLNSLIDGIRNLWYKSKEIAGGLKDKLLGSSKPDTADPVMVGRRGLLDAWSKFTSKVEKLKSELMPKVERVSEMVANIAAALKHHGGKMLVHAKEKATDKIQETLGYLSDAWSSHLEKAQESLEFV